MASDRERLAYLNQVAIPTVRAHGWMIEGHTQMKTGQGGQLTYTVGLTEAGRPELVIARLPHTLAAVILNDVARTHLHAQLRPGMEVPAAGAGWVRVVDAPGVVAPVARSLYGARVRFLQLLWAIAGTYPNQIGWSGSYPNQPIYSEPLPADRLPAGDGLVGLLDRLTAEGSG